MMTHIYTAPEKEVFVLYERRGEKKRLTRCEIKKAKNRDVRLRIMKISSEDLIN